MCNFAGADVPTYVAGCRSLCCIIHGSGIQGSTRQTLGKDYENHGDVRCIGLQGLGDIVQGDDAQHRTTSVPLRPRPTCRMHVKKHSIVATPSMLGTIGHVCKHLTVNSPQTPSGSCNESLLRKWSNPAIAPQDNGASYTYKSQQHHMRKLYHI